jgi:hypothetical protein
LAKTSGEILLKNQGKKILIDLRKRESLDFQSCTFNRSVTSPGSNLPGFFYSFPAENRELVQGVSKRAAPCPALQTANAYKMSPATFFGCFDSVLPIEITTYHTALPLAKRNLGFICGARSGLVHRITRTRCATGFTPIKRC